MGGITGTGRERGAVVPELAGSGTGTERAGRGAPERGDLGPGGEPKRTRERVWRGAGGVWERPEWSVGVSRSSAGAEGLPTPIPALARCRWEVEASEGGLGTHWERADPDREPGGVRERKSRSLRWVCFGATGQWARKDGCVRTREVGREFRGVQDEGVCLSLLGETLGIPGMCGCRAGDVP